MSLIWSVLHGNGTSEEIVGRALREYARRDDIVLATKLGLPMHSGPGGSGLSPLAGGRATKPWGDRSTRRAETNRDVDFDGRPLIFDTDKAIVDAIERIAQQRGMSMAQVALAWVLKNPVVDAPVVGATTPHHLAEAVAALDIRLTDTEIRSLEEPYVTRTPTYFG
ncbi:MULTISPECIES: aldo/keto reductase [unclassified Nocardia]|uniref:aldo/keto reductase n=1 Tax=unclassified Nocardia TaxID=2637762 RepID=UPI001CE3CAA5|nr:MULTISPECIES: aldo/keto reductase [unclassified Nocardia]